MNKIKSTLRTIFSSASNYLIYRKIRNSILMPAISILMLSLFVACAQQSPGPADTADADVPEEDTRGTLEIVQERGVLYCGVASDLPGFTSPDSTGRLNGLDVDTCRAIAAAVLGDSERVQFFSLTARERFTALQSGEIDVLVRNTTWTMTRDTTLGLNFVGVNYYDGQGFMVRSNLGITDASQLDGVSVCVGAGTTSELNLADFFRTNNLEFTAVTFETTVQTRDGFAAGRCEVLTSDTSQLASIRSQLDDPTSAVILPQVISKEPLGPLVRQGDDEWFNVIKWVLNALINAEEYEVTSENVASLRANSDNPNVRRLLGTEGEMGAGIGLEEDWAYNIISQIGNYGEIFDRNVGVGSPLGLPRGVNDLWSRGGILYAPPIR